MYLYKSIFTYILQTNFKTCQPYNMRLLDNRVESTLSHVIVIGDNRRIRVQVKNLIKQK